MSEEILVNVSPRETRVAVVEHGVMQEVHIERSARRGLVGSIFKGKVSRVLPGMQAAFIDIGLERAGFIHINDISTPRDPEFASDLPKAPPGDIRQLLAEGREVLVQITKDPVGSKGARLTTFISIPSRFLVFMPEGKHAGVSLKIEQAEERDRLKQILNTGEEERSGSFIARTVAEGISAEELTADKQFLRKLWQFIQERNLRAKKGTCVYEDLPLSIRALRDLVAPSVERIRIDSRDSYMQAKEFTQQFSPDMSERLEYYPGERPIFDLFGIEDELQRALGRKIELKSGGHLVIDQTEAMTTIDVNTGAFVGHRNLEETIFRTNLDACVAIARQLRLRNLGGIIIIDFIDMEDDEHKRQVLRALEKALEKDRTRCYISGVSSLGLVQMTRKRTRESLTQSLCEVCATCHGRGRVKTVDTICNDIFREILRAERAYQAEGYLILGAATVIDHLMEDASTHLAELETSLNKSITLQSEQLYTQEQFDVVLM